MLAPTLQRALAALVARQEAQGPLTLAPLPAEQESLAMRNNLTAPRARLASAQYHFALHSSDPELRRFRPQWASCWDMDKSLDENCSAG